jgi:hypothetical protein
VDTIGAADDGTFEYEVAPGVHPGFALSRTSVSATGVTGEPEVSRQSSLAGVEAAIEAVLDRDAGELSRVVVAPLLRTLHYRDGRQLVFQITPVILDWRCLGCRADTLALDEYYMVHDDLWFQASPTGAGHLCIGCLEARIGRRLTPGDFTSPSLDGRYSDRLRDRTGGDRAAGATDSCADHH